MVQLFRLELNALRGWTTFLVLLDIEFLTSFPSTAFELARGRLACEWLEEMSLIFFIGGGLEMTPLFTIG